MKAENIFVVGGIHGNERFSLKVLGKIRALDALIETYIAHPEAIAKNKRYLEADLNRSFKDKNSLESKLAKQLVQNVEARSPDLLFDLHTSTVDVGLVAILAESNSKLIKAAKQLGVDRIVIMPSFIADKSLIGQFPDRAICLEIGRNLRSDKLAMNLARRVAGLDKIPLRKVSLLTVKTIISKEEGAKSELINYKYCQVLHGYPFLAGEKNYDGHCGFLADSMVEV